MNEMNLTYREATVLDAPSIVQQIIESTDEPHPGEEFIEARTKRWKGYIEGTHTPRSGKGKERKELRVIYLAFDLDTLVGHVAAHHCTEDGLSELQSIYVHREYHRKGIGTALLHMAVDWLVSTGIKSMMVGFWEDNPYQQFYLKYGGVKTRPHRCDWHDLSQLQSLSMNRLLG